MDRAQPLLTNRFLSSLPTMVWWMSETMMRVSETATCVFIASSIWECRVSNSHTEAIKRTLKILRILTRSNFQAAILSLSFFACRCREITFRFRRSMIFVSISATALGSDRNIFNEILKVCVAKVTHVFSCLIAWRTDLLRSFNLFPSSPRPRTAQTSAQVSPSSM